MATNVRNRSVGILILSLGPMIFGPTIFGPMIFGPAICSRAVSETVTFSAWFRRVLRMRFASALRTVSYHTETARAFFALSHFWTENRIPPLPPQGQAFPKNAPSASKLAAQVRGRRLRGALQAEGRDEAALLVHQIGDGGV